MVDLSIAMLLYQRVSRSSSHFHTQTAMTSVSHGVSMAPQGSAALVYQTSGRAVGGLQWLESPSFFHGKSSINEDQWAFQ